MEMQLIMAIVQDREVNKLTKALNEADFRATKLATTGGFLKSYNTTLLIGCEDERVGDALEIIKSNSTPQIDKSSTEYPMRANKDFYNMSKIEVGGATVFVLPIEAFHQF